METGKARGEKVRLSNSFGSAFRAPPIETSHFVPRATGISHARQLRQIRGRSLTSCTDHTSDQYQGSRSSVHLQDGAFYDMLRINTIGVGVRI